MKSTGVIRKIDELGRIVLPKEIRRNLSIRDGESLEIFVEEDKIVLKKYSKIKDYGEIIGSICSIVHTVYDFKMIVTDRDKVVYTNLDASLLGTDLDMKFIQFIQNRESVLSSVMQEYSFNGVVKKGYFLIQPIISSIDCLGLIVFYSEQPFKEDYSQILKLISNLIVSKIDIS